MIRTLKEVLHDQIHESDIPLKVLKDRLNVSYSYLANAINPDLPDFQFQLRLLIPLIQNTKDFQVLDYIEAAVGRSALEIPKTGDPKQVHIELCKAIKEFGDLTSEAGKALEDGKITQKEAKLLEKETMELVGQAFSFLRSIQEAAT